MNSTTEKEYKFIKTMIFLQEWLKNTEIYMNFLMRKPEIPWF